MIQDCQLLLSTKGLSEETGVMDFSNYLANKFDFPVAHFPQGSGYITFWS